MTTRKTRVRFAPSPTGPLHIGGVRTALFNYLYAGKNNGIFILRIEDTDQGRFVPGAEEYIIESLKWCGLHYDEGPDKGGPYGPYRQSDRRDLYRKYADLLIASGNAYYAFDTPEETEERRKEAEAQGKTFQYDASTRGGMKNSVSFGKDEAVRLIQSGMPYVIRFKMPDNEEVRIKDRIRGEVVFNSSLLDDKVLFKADGLPTYHLANVVDDYLMEITDVIRGEEWLPSLPLHVLLYRAFGWEDRMPVFSHLPLILKPGGQGKLSKRDGDKLGFPVFPLQWKDPFTGEISGGYREAGYIPGAVVNMLAFLGWNPGTEQEIFSMDELVAAFELERVGKSGSRFDPEKAKWYNQQYLKMIPDKDLAESFMKEINSKGIVRDPVWIEKVVSLVRERLVFEADLWHAAWYFFQAPDTYDAQMMKKVWKEDTNGLIAIIVNILESLSDFSHSEIEKAVREYTESHNVNPGKIMAPLRLLIVGSGTGPGIYDIMEMIGKEETIQRIKIGINKIK